MEVRPGYVYAAIGDVRDDAHFIRYLRECEASSNPIEVERAKLRKEFEAIILRDGVPYFADKNCILTRLDHPFIAQGSGWELATAAMHMGLSAYDAVMFACELDIYSSPPLDIYDSTKQTYTRRKKRATRKAPPTQTEERSG